MDQTCSYLIEHKMLSAESILDGKVVIRNAARRNRNLSVILDYNKGYHIKQPDEGTIGSWQTLSREAAFYQACQTMDSLVEIRRFLPRLCVVDETVPLFVQELLVPSEPLWKHYQGSDPGLPFPYHVSEAGGQAIGAIHRCFRGMATDAGLPWAQSFIPFGLSIHKPGLEMFQDLSPANYQSLHILQSSEDIYANLKKLPALWIPDTIIHGDIKSDNILVIVDSDQQDSIRLVDWETVQLGDPAWDVAGMLQDFLLFWIFSMSQTGGSVEAMVASATYPLPMIQPAIRAFWRGYQKAADIDRAGSSILLHKAILFSGARLCQSAFEMAQKATALPAVTVLLLQMSANILRDPERSQVQLYGLFQGAGSYK
jgi:hypothetical protein